MNNLTNKDKYSLKLASQMGIHSNNDEAFRSFARFGQFELVKYLIKNGADIHANNDEALRSSAQRGYFDIAEYLIKNGANVHAENEEALCNSANNEHFDIVKLLVEHGADVQYKDLFLNITYNGNNKKEGSRIDIITKYLLQKGANLKQYDEKSIVHILNNIAFRNTVTETSSMIEYLLENSSLNKEQKKTFWVKCGLKDI